MLPSRRLPLTVAMAVVPPAHQVVWVVGAWWVHGLDFPWHCRECRGLGRGLPHRAAVSPPCHLAFAVLVVLVAVTGGKTTLAALWLARLGIPAMHSTFRVI